MVETDLMLKSLSLKPFSWHSWHLAFRRCLANLARYFHSFSQIQIWHAISTVFANSNLARYYHSFSQNQIWHAISTVFSANSNLARYFHFFLQIQIWNSISTVFRKFTLRFACYIHGFPANLRAKMQSPPLQAIFVVGKHPKCADWYFLVKRRLVESYTCRLVESWRVSRLVETCRVLRLVKSYDLSRVKTCRDW